MNLPIETTGLIIIEGIMNLIIGEELEENKIKLEFMP